MRFIKDFFKIVKPLYNFDEACSQAFWELKEKLSSTPILSTLD